MKWQHVGEAEFERFIEAMCSPSTHAWTLRHGCTLALASVLRHASSRVCASSSLLLAVVNSLKARAKDDKVYAYLLCLHLKICCLLL